MHQKLLRKNQVSQKNADDLSDMILSVDVHIWNDADRPELLKHIMTSTTYRRSSQRWCEAVLNIFTKTELDRFRSVGDQNGGMQTLADIFQHVRSLGDKNLCELSKKLLAATWLHFRGCPSYQTREQAQYYFKERYARFRKHFDPAFYHETLSQEFWKDLQL